MPPDVKIGELRLAVPGMSAADGERLGCLVAELLVGVVPSRPVGALAMSMQASADASVETLAAAIADRVVVGLGGLR